MYIDYYAKVWMAPRINQLHNQPAYVTHASNKIGYTYLLFTNDISFSLQISLTRTQWRTKKKTWHKPDHPNVNT